ncbi:ABC superfamily ATP binding cassette transporter ABC protein [Paenibacillus algicola]|uniref:ABC superfamily ATP binding cassette transporter ABC protein n=1 Tax=Paenibacillus algicola TaxID=2565926 RepID=A0A4P8XLR3_9BACL|nr:ABC superfamily ATP binding cassette transporter ABC protein [Paenibacillus algicola]
MERLQERSQRKKEGIALIQLNQIQKKFGERVILEDVSYYVQQGDIVGLLGPNGAGKTTLIRLMNGVISPDGGTLSVFGLNPAQQGNEIRSRCGVVTESAGLYQDMSARENLDFFSRLYSCRSAARIESLLERFQLAKHGEKKVGAYSTGMKKRLAIAKAMLHEPELLFLDEPTNGLDPDGIRDMIGFLRQLNQEEGTTIMICSHVLYQLEDICDTYLFLDQGRLIESGTLPELEARYAGAVKLVVESTLTLKDALSTGFACEELGQGKFMFTVPARDEVPDLLRKVLSCGELYSAEIVNRDLESLYFEVRRRQHEH